MNPLVNSLFGGDVLDDIERVRRIDRSDMIGHCLKMAAYCVDSVKMSKGFIRDARSKIAMWDGKISSIIVAGVGGSAIGGDLLKGWIKEEIDAPIEVCRDYQLPKYADEDTLVFTVSYSGRTEETLSIFIDAVKKGCRVVAVTSGGHLEKFANEVGAPLIKVPADIPPRAALPYLFFPPAIVLEELGLIRKHEREIEEATSILDSLKEEVKPEVSTDRNESKKIALNVFSTIPIVVGYGFLKAVADRFRTQFNENSKLISISECFPEINHNLIMGLELDDSISRSITVIVLRSQREPEEIKKRIDITNSLAFLKASKVIEIESRGKNTLSNILSTILIGDVASVYLAILRNVDPTPVTTIERLKSEFKRRIDSTRALELEFSKVHKRYKVSKQPF